MATISILANRVRPSVDRRSDNTAFVVGTFSWQDPAHSWKAGPGEVITVENSFILFYLKVTVANQAIELLKNWVKIGVTSETTYTWTKSKTKEFAEGKIVTLGSNGSNGKLVKPGWKWVVSQLVGVAGFAEISTDKYKSTDLQCNT